ncbi:class I SAM-dependent methyltransferase [Actinoplanes sp. KI2]|uniref:class I SAM-dependent methyltransferase n=1 Tax=Actinoplanes sp. KI2 TaxID=2983315 RepID=UPI0021D5A6EA|nr:class I SAM-dependent methyltransferase [Actinoplanes sp. KI2]MCU7724554.1 class I SAM-dependent methyltransferase [Actinoplanes sp. KI2]
MSDTRTLMSATVAQDLDTIKGWFNASDRRMFARILERQARLGELGDVVELGCYLGKSAVLIGDYLRPGETFTVLDLFESDAPDAENSVEMQRSYSTLTQAAFERNYLRFHPDLPVVVKAPSSAIVDHVAPASCRFIHIDASHLYEHVATDVDSACKLLRPDGIVVFDDFRAEHTPGVACAVWEAVLNKGLQPICLTESKLYGTWGDAGGVRADLEAWLSHDPFGFVETQRVAGHPMLRAKVRLAPAPAVAHPSAPKPAAPIPEPHPRTGLRRIAKDWLPPVVHARIAAARRR